MYMQWVLVRDVRMVRTPHKRRTLGMWLYMQWVLVRDVRTVRTPHKRRTLGMWLYMRWVLVRDVRNGTHTTQALHAWYVVVHAVGTRT